ncbi:hypothetical protein GQ55_3G332900 [Panicum hallii var. hallii]|jgi:hypothetical protein|uniref:Uncharacterized protein n=2 Tax=Panicum hallii TaxID=206008 RepID=A0A2T7EFL3_9POAL|nr:uncharacterized protein LOC112887162 [Panicum hallii]PUZ66614.1 hypothetical protein GQ55_3G332900 [Panicum hallii var. hallii]PVH62636.1 hypothetical protein PAHAL_3G345500 [Panicum hallii]
MLDKEDWTRMLPKSSSQKTLRAAMQEERATMASRLLSKDPSSVSNPSFRVYYGVASAGSVPFMWESAPGTPKNSISDTTLPPLTPPPSYYSKKGAAAKTKFSKSQSSKKLLSSSKPASFVQSILPKLRRSHTMPSRSPTSAPPSKDGAQVQCTRSRSRLLASPRSSFSSNSRGDEDDDGGAASSPTSTLCFRTRHSGGGTGRLHGLLASVVGGQGTAAS